MAPVSHIERPIPKRNGNCFFQCEVANGWKESEELANVNGVDDAAKQNNTTMFGVQFQADPCTKVQ